MDFDSFFTQPLPLQKWQDSFEWFIVTRSPLPLHPRQTIHGSQCAYDLPSEYFYIAYTP